MKLIVITERRAQWIKAEVEDNDGNLLGSDIAPVVEGATFNAENAVVRSAVEQALHLLEERRA